MIFDPLVLGHIQIFFTFIYNPRIEGVCKDRICACMVL